MIYKLKINGTEREVEADGEMPLLWALRDVLAMTGTKYGCGAGFCGACSVLMNGEAVRACVTAMASVGDANIETIENMSQNPVGKRVQKAWLDLDVVQCGYCQSGQIISAVALLSQVGAPTDEDIDQAMYGNICRCGTYPRIRAAIHAAAREES